MRIPLAVTVASLVIAACGAAAAPRTTATPAATATTAYVFLPRCDGSVRTQADLDLAGLPPLVPTDPLLRCLIHASAGGSAFDAGSTHEIGLADGRSLHLYERRGGPPQKAGPAQALREGIRDVAGAPWTWSVLANGATTLRATVRDVYVEAGLAGDASQVDTLARIASSLRPVASLPRPPAREICAALKVLAAPITVAAAFDSTAAAIAAWDETPMTPGGPHVTVSDFRRHPPDEPVALCYLDGAFGIAKQPPPEPGASPLPNWDRVVYLVGADRKPIGRIFGWRDRITIRDPGR